MDGDRRAAADVDGDDLAAPQGSPEGDEEQSAVAQIADAGVVDEDATTVRTLTDVLTTRGYSVVEAHGDDLLERAKAVQPDIIMLNSVSKAQSDAVQMLRFEKGMENVLFLVYQ